MMERLRSQYILAVFLVLATTMLSTSVAEAQKTPMGLVTEHSGEPGDLIASRDGIVYRISQGDELFLGDTLRVRTEATIIFSGCTYTLPQNEDIYLDYEFCSLVANTEPSMAFLASEGRSAVGASEAISAGFAPLVVGGIVLSSGGLAAAIGGDDGGTGSIASQQAGATSSNSVSPG